MGHLYRVGQNDRAGVKREASFSAGEDHFTGVRLRQTSDDRVQRADERGRGKGRETGSEFRAQSLRQVDVQH